MRPRQSQHCTHLRCVGAGSCAAAAHQEVCVLYSVVCSVRECIRSVSTASVELSFADSETPGLTQRIAREAGLAVAGLAAASLLLTQCGPACADTLIRLPASKNPEVFAAQRTLVEAWTIVGESFVDPGFNSQDWKGALQRHMMAAYAAGEEAADGRDPNSIHSAAWDQINAMLDLLGDPFTRRIEPQEYAQFRVSADGELQGIGLLIANELTSSGHLRVLAPIKGGPADRAGIKPGDEVISINGEDTAGWSGDHAANILRGRGGTEVRVKLARRTEGIPGVPARPEPALKPVQFKEVAMKRESVAISPVFSTTLPDVAGGPGVGYVRLSQFSGNAAADMRNAVAALERKGTERYILDLRSNPGGLVQAGVDVAALWLDGLQTVFNVWSREGGLQRQTTERPLPALTHDPLVVLVDGMSASASEIVSGALHDNGRALLMGDSSTYGKGRIQSVFELQDGSALFVTVAKYQTPAGTDIDHKGIRPDLSCTPSLTAPSLASLPPGSSPSARLQANVYQGAPPARDSAWAASGPRQRLGSNNFLPGIPLDPSTEALLVQALKEDSCVLAAEQYLDSLRPQPLKAPAVAGLAPASPPWRQPSAQPLTQPIPMSSTLSSATSISVPALFTPPSQALDQDGASLLHTKLAGGAAASVHEVGHNTGVSVQAANGGVEEPIIVSSSSGGGIPVPSGPSGDDKGPAGVRGLGTSRRFPGPRSRGGAGLGLGRQGPGARGLDRDPGLLLAAAVVGEAGPK
ncbi:hypothetical protein QJQ45_023077 [Haematococcus lacustris]|nr:hypothetical protein QJQ45_023077 [Haematococcus lacustris]